MQSNGKAGESADLLARWRAPSAPDSPCISLNKERCFYLSVCFSNDDRMAYPYAQTTRIEFNKSVGITIFLYRGKLMIRGRKLDSLYEELLKERVAAVSQLREDPAVTESIPWITQIDFQPDANK